MRILITALLALLCFAATPARACTDNTGQLIAGLLTPLIEQLPTGGLQEAAAWLLPRVQNDLSGLLDAAKLKDDRALRAYLQEQGQGALAEWIVSQGGAKWLWSEIDQLSPRLAAILYRTDGAFEYGLVPRALTALADSGRIPGPTIEALATAWPTLQLTPADEDWLAKVAAEEWIAVRSAERDPQGLPVSAEE